MSEIPEDIWVAAKAVREDWLTAEPLGDTAVTHAIAMGMAAERKAWQAKYDKQVHRATNAEYMLLAYRNMLGEKGLAVAKEWEERGVQRIHFDWGPEAHKLTGEERAQFILNMNNVIPAHPDTLTDEAKLRRSQALDELGALDGEELA